MLLGERGEITAKTTANSHRLQSRRNHPLRIPSVGYISLKSRSERKALSEIIIPRLKDEGKEIRRNEKGNKMKIER